MSMQLRAAFWCVSASALSIAFAAPAAAQEEPQADKDNMIIVTAQFREQSVQEA